MNLINNNAAIIFHFPYDKISKSERNELATQFSKILGINTLVCDKDCEITIIKSENSSFEQNK